MQMRGGPCLCVALTGKTNAVMRNPLQHLTWCFNGLNEEVALGRKSCCRSQRGGNTFSHEDFLNVKRRFKIDLMTETHFTLWVLIFMQLHSVNHEWLRKPHCCCRRHLWANSCRSISWSPSASCIPDETNNPGGDDSSGWILTPDLLYPVPLTVSGWEHRETLSKPLLDDFSWPELAGLKQPMRRFSFSGGQTQTLVI